MTESYSTSAQRAIERLREGNERYARDLRSTRTAPTAEHRAALASAQQPFAIVLGCSDSRVPVELLFDQGLGDLFVIRVAGNVASSATIGSVEFAASVLESPLCVVLGHSRCGAVAAGVDAAMSAAERPGGHLGEIVASVQPAVDAARSSDGSAGVRADGRDRMIEDAVRRNVELTIQRLEAQSEILAERIAAGALHIVGAVYDLETGEVRFL